MLHYLLALLAILVMLGEPLSGSLSALGSNGDYLIAFGIAMMLKPWLERQFA